MNLAVVNEAVTEMNGVEHQFTEEEKNFVVQFAFRSGSKEDTISLIEALAHSAAKAESDEIMVTYRSKYDMNRSDFMPEDIQTLNKGCVRFKSGYIPGESEIREAMDRAMIMQLNLLPVARKMVLEELEMKQNG